MNEPAESAQSYRALVWRQFRRDKVALVSLVLMALLFAVALAAPFLANRKPILLRIGGEWSSPMLREFFAPDPGTPESVLVRIFNYGFLYFIGWLIILLPLKYIAGGRPAGKWIRRGAAALLAMGCLIPFLLTDSILDTTDYRQLVQNTPGSWALFSPLKYGPYEQQFAIMYGSPSAEHVLGTDNLGRDVLARMIYGSRVSLSVGFLAIGIAVLIGVAIGAISAYYGGKTDLVLQRIVEIVICFPTFLLILTIMAFIEKRSIFNVMLVIGLTGWTGVTRLIRGQMLQEKAKDYVVAARALGAGAGRTIFRHLLPNSIAPVFVAATFGVAGAVLTESGLSFLGFGVSPPTASWGEMLNQAMDRPTGYWWLTIFPGIAIFLTVTVYNLVGEGMRDALDPRLKI